MLARSKKNAHNAHPVPHGMRPQVSCWLLDIVHTRSTSGHQRVTTAADTQRDRLSPLKPKTKLAWQSGV